MIQIIIILNYEFDVTIFKLSLFSLFILIYWIYCFRIIKNIAEFISILNSEIR